MKAVRIRPRVMHRRPHTPLQAPLQGAPIFHAFQFPARDDDNRGDEPGERDGESEYLRDPDDFQRKETRSLARATLASSGMPHTGMHYPMLDLDHHVEVYASSTPGNHHLYIGTPLPWDDYLKVLRAFAEVGLIQQGYLGASAERGYTSLRLPWVRKQESRASQDYRFDYEKPFSWLRRDRDSLAVEGRMRGELRKVEGEIEVLGKEPEWAPGVMKLFGRRRVVTMEHATVNFGNYSIVSNAMGPADQRVRYGTRVDLTQGWIRLRGVAEEIAERLIHEAQERAGVITDALDDEMGNLSGVSGQPF